jgi:hypothetical protein
MTDVNALDDEAAAEYRTVYDHAYWRTVARDEGAELGAGIEPDGPYTDYAGNLVDAEGNPIDYTAQGGET